MDINMWIITGTRQGADCCLADEGSGAARSCQEDEEGKELLVDVVIHNVFNF